ncbi:hypothetical protein GCM10023219_04430 [Stakelama sediminis]|uniref:Uncharacterized protein HemX n=1 Tax=Stakelama sediminis TaxID=463200 RepID=A0A840YUB0_9SPHN|nr:hypothetical protein [Stakelama sediminis]MBB5717157.1 uncharacterized protein HemX [Stakelama sediminis]
MTERVTERNDGVTNERVTERDGGGTTTVIERRGGGGGLLIGLAVLILVVVGAYFLLNQSHNDNMKTQAVTSAAKSVGDTAKKAGDAIDPSSN